MRAAWAACSATPPARSRKRCSIRATPSARKRCWPRAQYALTGAVDEWRYKVGVDGEPAAGVTLRIVDVATGNTLWSGAGGKSGWSREALSAVAQKLIRQLLDSGLSGAR